MRISYLKYAAVVGIISLTGCATILSGTHDPVTIDSDPPGARILIDGIHYGDTPTTIDLKRPGLSDTHVRLELDGYRDHTFRLQKEFTTISILNLGCVICWGIDALSGAIMRYDPMFYNIELRPAGTALWVPALPDTVDTCVAETKR